MDVDAFPGGPLGTAHGASLYQLIAEFAGLAAGEVSRAEPFHDLVGVGT